MTITGIAKQLNVSTMTIYRRCKKRGVLLDDLRDAETGELTAAGVSVIASLFDATGPQTALTGDATRTSQGYDSETQTASQGTAAASMAVRVAELTATVDGQRILIDQLRDERDNLRRQVAALTAALEREQTDRQAERRLLTAGVDSEADEAAKPRRRWWPWARR